MTNGNLLSHLRAANPAPADRGDNGALFRQIVATPGDARLDGRRPRAGGRRRRTVVLMAALAVGGGTAYAAGDGSPLDLFQRDPNHNADPASPWSASVVPSTIRVVARADVPGVGGVRYWHARTSGGGNCFALQLPDGQYSGTGLTGIDGGGTMPGCSPTRQQVNGDDPVYVITGFEYNEALIAMPKQDRRWRGRLSVWRVTFGQLDPGVKADRVTDTGSGITVPVERGRYFVLPRPDPTGNDQPRMHLKALSAKGRVVADDGGR